MVATNDLHYTDAADADAHEVLLCVQSGKTMDDPNRFKFDARDFYLKSPAEMRALWDGKYQLREACDNTLLIAERCAVDLRRVARPTCRGSRCRTGRPSRPGSSRRSSRGLAGRFPGGIPPEVQKQADYEVGVITQMGFPGYFLVVADFINWAKDNGIRVGPGPRVGRRLDGRLRHADHRPRPAAARADLRAVPQPRPRLDARLRRGLRRAPARRRDPVRHREVRRRPGRADRHLRHHQGQAGRQGLRPGARACRSPSATGSPR